MLRNTCWNISAIVIACATALVMAAPEALSKTNPQALVEALESGDVFGSGIRVSARIRDDEAIISTYRNNKATDDDCRIEAVLAAKTVIDLEPEDIFRVTIYFYESNLATYKCIYVTKGDVKSFESGQTSKEELLKSLRIKTGEMSDAGENVANYLDASRRNASRRKFKTRIKGQDIEILCQMDAWVADEDCKLEAVRLAQQALRAAQGYKRVKIIFTDPKAGMQDRYVELPQETLKILATNLNSLLETVPLSNDPSKWLPSDRVDIYKVEINSLKATPGMLFDERAELLERLQDLSKAGVGVTPFLEAFMELEDKAAQKDEEETRVLLTKLAQNVDEQEENAIQAKNYKPKKGKNAKSDPAEPQKKQASEALTDDGSMDIPEIREKILANPKQAYNYWRMRYWKKDHGPEDFPNYLRLLKVFVKTLVGANRAKEASPYQSEVEKIRKLHPDWKI